MKNDKECQYCGAVYIVSLIKEQRDRDWNLEEETFDADSDELYPEFCPYCGAHEDEEPIEENISDEE